MSELLYKHTIKVGGCFIGDPCYASDDSYADDIWHDFKKQNFCDAPDLGCKAMIYGTGVGDGHFKSIATNDYGEWVDNGCFPVDAGVLGVVNALYFHENCTQLMHYFPNAKSVTMGVWAMKHHRKFKFTVVDEDDTRHTVVIRVPQWD